MVYNQRTKKHYEEVNPYYMLYKLNLWFNIVKQIIGTQLNLIIKFKIIGAKPMYNHAKWCLKNSNKWDEMER